MDLGDQDIEQLLLNADKDDTGFIDLDEFLTMLGRAGMVDPHS